MAGEMERTADEPWDEYDGPDDQDDCPNCGGEGYVSDCFDGCCINAEDGCDLCTHRCDWCNPRPRRVPAKDHAASRPASEERS